MTPWAQPAPAAFPRAGGAALREDVGRGWRARLAASPSPAGTRGGELGRERARARLAAPRSSSSAGRAEAGPREGRPQTPSFPAPSLPAPPQRTTSSPPSHSLPNRAHSAHPGASPSATMSK